MLAQATVGFPLSFVIELIASALVREGPVASLVLDYVWRLVPGESWLKVKNRTLVPAAQAVIMNRAHNSVLRRTLACSSRAEGRNIEFDFNSEIFANTTQSVS